MPVALGLWLIILCAIPRAGGAEEVAYLTSDGVSVLADLYRPQTASSRGVILLPGLGGERAEWKRLAELMAAQGWHVLTPSLRGSGGSYAGPGRADLSEAERGRLWRDAEAAERFLRGAMGDSLSLLVMGGANIGGTAAAVYASRAAQPPRVLLLLSPAAELAGVQLAPLVIGLGLPCLILASRDDPASAVAHELYLAAPSACTLWEVDGGASGTRLLAGRDRLRSDLASWCAQPPSSAP